MAFYRDRGDGLIEVVHDDGTTTPGLPPSMAPDLEATGILAQPAGPSLAERGATAGVADFVDDGDQAARDYALGMGRQAPQPSIRVEMERALGAPIPAPQSQRSHTQQAQQSRFDQLSQVGPESGTVDYSSLSGAPQATQQMVNDPRIATAQEVMAEMQRGTYVPGSPARDVLVGFTEQGRAPLPQEELERRRENLQAQAAEQRWQGELMAERGEREQLAEYVDLQRQYQQIERERELQLAREARAQELQREAEQAKAEIQQVDPRAYWNEMGGESRFLAILAVALGGFSAGFTGSGRNLALEMLQDAIRDNIDAQKHAISQQEERYTEARAAYERALEAAGGDVPTADLIYEIGLSQVFVQQARQYAAQVDNDLARSQAEQIALQMEEQIAEREAELQGLNRVRAEQWAHQPERRGGVVRPSYEQAMDRVIGRHERERKLGLRESDEEPDRADLARRVVLPDGTAVFAKDAQTATDSQGVLDSVQRYEQLSKEAIGLLDELGHSLPLSERRARLKAIGTQMALEVRDMARLGVISDSDVEVFMKPLSAMGSEEMTSHDPTVKAGLEQNMRINDRRRNQLLRQFAADPQMRRPVIPQDRVMGQQMREGW